MLTPAEQALGKSLPSMKNPWQKDAHIVEKIRAHQHRNTEGLRGKGERRHRRESSEDPVFPPARCPCPLAVCFVAFCQLLSETLMTNMSPSEALSKDLLCLCRSLSPIWASLRARGQGCRRKFRWLNCSWAPGGGLALSLPFLDATHRGSPRAGHKGLRFSRRQEEWAHLSPRFLFPEHSSPTNTNQRSSFCLFQADTGPWHGCL